MPVKYTRSQSQVPLHSPFTSALVHAKSLIPTKPRNAAPCGASAPRNLVTEVPLNVPRIPAGSCVLPPGLVPSMVVNSPLYVLAEQNRPAAFRHTRTLRWYVSKAQLLPCTPVSTSFRTWYEMLSTSLPSPQPRFVWAGDATASARTTGTRSPPTLE